MIEIEQDINSVVHLFIPRMKVPAHAIIKTTTMERSIVAVFVGQPFQMIFDYPSTVIRSTSNPTMHFEQNVNVTTPDLKLLVRSECGLEIEVPSQI